MPTMSVPMLSTTSSSSSSGGGSVTIPSPAVTTSHDSTPPTQDHTHHSVKDNMSKAQKREQLISVVQQLFPSYKPDAWLRCSVLFPPKPSSLPRLWQDCKKPQKRKKQTECSSPKRLRFGKTPPPEMCLSDDEVSMHNYSAVHLIGMSLLYEISKYTSLESNSILQLSTKYCIAWKIKYCIFNCYTVITRLVHSVS